jgi:hypothetical protein
MVRAMLAPSPDPVGEEQRRLTRLVSGAPACVPRAEAADRAEPIVVRCAVPRPYRAVVAGAHVTGTHLCRNGLGSPLVWADVAGARLAARPPLSLDLVERRR